MKINRDQVSEHEPHHFVTEASSIDIHPGGWPLEIETDIGNGRSLILSSKKIEDGDLIYAIYRQSLGCVSLKIFND